MKTINIQQYSVESTDVITRKNKTEEDLGRLDQNSEELERGESTFEIGDDHKDQFASAMAQKAAILLEKQKIKAALKYLRMGLERCPEHPECKAYMAICVALGQEDFPRAKKIAMEIFETHPDDPRAYYALGRIYLLADRRGIAFRNFSKSQALSRKDEVLHENLEKVEPRRSPVLPFLSRNHSGNRVLGWLRARLFPKKSRS